MKLRFQKDGTFKIMQITDMQEIPAISKDTIALMERAVLEEQPDLVVYTGDQIKGYGVTYKGKGEELEREVAQTIGKLLEPVTKRGIPFAVTFGNHDCQVGISNQDQFYHIYKRLPNCIGEQAEGIDGGGTCAIPIEASDGSGRDVFELYLFDSGTDASEGGYDGIIVGLPGSKFYQCCRNWIWRWDQCSDRLLSGRGGSQKSGSGSHAGTCACRDSWRCYDSLLYYDHAGFPADVHFIRSGH